MPLKDIINLCAGPAGINLQDAEQKTLLIQKINDAAKELYDKTDLVGSLREQIFEIDPKEQQISLPWYVDKVRGIRQFDLRHKVELRDMRPRYFHGRWNEVHNLSWRVKGIKPIGLSSDNFGPLKVKPLLPENEAFKVVITGSTDNSSKVVEELIFNPGDTEKTTTTAFSEFPGIAGIYKDKRTKYDIAIFDSDDEQISEIANSELQARFTVVHVSECSGIGISNWCCEILYKLKLSPMENAYDDFPCEGYDDAIAWQVLANFYATKEGQEFLAMGYANKSAALILEKDKNAVSGLETEMHFKPNRFLSAMESHTVSSRRTYGGYPLN